MTSKGTRTGKKKKTGDPAGSIAKSRREMIVNWCKSEVTHERLTEMERTGLLPKDIAWRAPGSETRPTPGPGEVIVFVDHIIRGFRPPGSSFFRKVLAYYGLHPQDIPPNSVLNVTNFQVLCENYLQIEPDLDLFLEYFYCNKHPEIAGGPLIMCGAVSFQRRKNIVYPAVPLASHPKMWQRTFFYRKDTSPSGEKPLPGYRADRLVFDEKMRSFAEPAAREKLVPLIRRVNALIVHGLTGLDLTKCWVKWHIQPLSIRNRLLCEYSGSSTDAMRYSAKVPTDSELVKMLRLLVNTSKSSILQTGLAPFSILNPAPAVSNLSICNFFINQFSYF